MGTCEWDNKYLLSDQSVVSRRSKVQGFYGLDMEFLELDVCSNVYTNEGKCFGVKHL